MDSDTPENRSTPQKRSLLKRFLLHTFTGLFLLIGLTILYIALGFGLGNIATESHTGFVEKSHTIYLETNGVHIDFIIPNATITDDPFLAQLIQPGYNYTAIGWGDKAFYLETPRWQDLTAVNFCRALFWKSDSLMHVSPYFQEQERWIPVHLSDTQLNSLKTFITQTFVKNNNTPEVIPEFSYYGDDRFYNAHGSYTAFYTCNNWVNEGLSVIGESTSLWSPFDMPILEHARDNHEVFLNQKQAPS